MESRNTSLLVVGGRQRKNALSLDEWQAYECGLILQVDCTTGSCRKVVEYVSPHDVCPDEKPSIVFKAGDLQLKERRLLVCTQTELIEYDLDTWQASFYFSHRSFNDVHHVRFREIEGATNPTVLVANTGLDQVVEIELNRSNPEESKIVQQWSTCQEDTWTRFDPKKDYRKVSTTKPHATHPNYVFETAGQMFATRFHQKDALNLDVPNQTLPIAIGNPHDGIVMGNQVCFTTTNGNLVFCDLEDATDRRVLDLNQITRDGDGQGSELLGWCRGVCFDNESNAWVGFSRIRPTWLRKNLSWIKQGFRTKGEYGTRPTRIVKYDLNREKHLEEIDLEEYGMNAVFGIYLIT